MAKRSNLRFLILTGSAFVVLLAAVLSCAWFLPRHDLPPNAAKVLGHPLPADATVLGTSRFTGTWFSGLLGLNTDGHERAVVEMDEQRFEKLWSDAGYKPFSRKDANWPRHQSDPTWWDIANLPGTPEYVMERKGTDGSVSHHHVKYERGRVYAMRFFYAAR